MISSGFLLCGLLLSWQAGAAAPAQHREHHPPAASGGYARVLEDPGREAWQKPAEVVAAMGLRPSDVLADIGAGTGYFARRFAPLVKRVLAIDIDAELLEEAAHEGLENLETRVTAPDDPGLGEAAVDIVFFCNVLHHIDHRGAYLAKVRRGLKPGGRVMIVDFHKRPLPVGPPPSMKLSRDEVVGEFGDAGFILAREHDFLPYQYFLEFVAGP